MSEPAPSLLDIMSILKGIKESTDKTDMYMAHSDLQFTNIKSNIEEMTATIDNLNRRIAALESKPSIVPDRTKTTSDAITKQDALRKNICIFGIPFSANENLDEVIASIGSAVGFIINKNDVTNAHRAGTNNVLIIATFTNFRKKLEFLSAKKSKRSIRTSELGLTADVPDQPVYVNNHLTPYFSRIFNMGRKAVAEKVLAACWVSSNCICVRKTESSEMCQIRDIKDMEALCVPASSTPINPVPSSTQPTPHLEPQTALSSAITTRSTKRKAAPTTDNASVSKIAKSSVTNSTEAASKSKSPKSTSNKSVDGSSINIVPQVNASNTSNQKT